MTLFAQPMSEADQEVARDLGRLCPLRTSIVLQTLPSGMKHIFSNCLCGCNRSHLQIYPADAYAKSVQRLSDAERAAMSLTSCSRPFGEACPHQQFAQPKP